MKNMKKIVALLLVLSMALALGACKGGNGGNGGRDKNTLNILVFDGGYGTDYIERIAEAFEAEYPGIDVVVETTDLFSEIKQQVEADRYVADIIMTCTNYTNLGVKGKVHDITDVYNSYAFGESDKTIKEKLGEAADANEFDGKYYQLSMNSGSTGLVYNKVYLDAIYGEGNYELPVTSNGLISMFDDIKSKNAWPIVYTCSTEAEYATWLRDIWTAQYMGYEEYANYYSLQYTDSEGNVKTAQSAAELSASIRPARESAIKALANIMSNKLGYAPESCSSMSFSQAQAYFVGYTSQPDAKVVNGNKGAAFMINGDWLWSEIEKYGQMVDLDIRFMRTPINSAIIDKLSTVNSEEQLVECIKYIDTVLDGTAGTKPAYLSDADYNTLVEARRMVWTTHAQQIATIPVNCSDVNVAKDFLKFMASDASSLMYSDALNGMTSIFNSNVCATNKLNSFTQSINYALNTNPIRVTNLTTPYVAYGSHCFIRYYYFVQELYKSSNVETTANDIINWAENNFSQNWNNIVESYQP